ncbi:o-succinylbenzoate synthase [Polystyrenella longa]|uniref:o-succinylbenzoate synthase n=1 Tax=Polystyrenella longa TaxID=2528007 RepID=A0A518CLW5_9PLAN|nr:o-succinylbenzoate synthase [Polystyrenella longa]QDU80215.1 o-succinylbenzoate synthase [Polystyrenella longa]
MKIDRIELFLVAMPLITPWRTAYGEDAEVHSVLCRMTSGSVDAWGESCSLAAPCYSPGWGAGVFELCRQWLAPQIIGQDISSGEELHQKLSHFKGNPFAKAILDHAWWALESKLQNQPLHRLLGATRDEVVVGADFGVTDSLAELNNDIGDALDRKFPRVKLKFRPGWGLEMVQAVRKEFPDACMHIDCNSGYRLNDVELFKQLDEYQLAMYEQPLQHDDILDHSRLQAQITTPICLDETVKTRRIAQQAAEIESCGYVNIKPARVGGLTIAKQIHDDMQKAGIPCWVGGMLESATGVGLCIALSMLDNFTYPADIFPSERFYHQDLSDSPVSLYQDKTGVPTVRAFDQLPEPNLERLEKLSLQKADIR